MLMWLVTLACTMGPYSETFVYLEDPVLVKAKRERKHHFEFKRLGSGNSGFVHTCEEKIVLYVNGEQEDYFNGESIEQSWSVGKCPNLTYTVAMSPKNYFVAYVIEIENGDDIRQIPIPGRFEVRSYGLDMSKKPVPFEVSTGSIDFDNLGNLPTEEEWKQWEADYEAYLEDTGQQ